MLNNKQRLETLALYQKAIRRAVNARLMLKEATRDKDQESVEFWKNSRKYWSKSVKWHRNNLVGIG